MLYILCVCMYLCTYVHAYMQVGAQRICNLLFILCVCMYIRTYVYTYIQVEAQRSAVMAVALALASSLLIVLPLAPSEGQWPYIYMNIYVYVCIHMYIRMYIYIC